MAQPLSASPSLEIAGWKNWTAWACALVLAVLFFVSGMWKLSSPLDWSARIVQLQVPASLSLLTTLGVGIAEAFGAALIVVPRFRRWGAALIGLLLLAFMIYIGANYNVLRGEECSCFPWLKRSVGPGFFIGDAAMLAMALAAGVWAPVPRGVRAAALTLAAIAVFAAASYGFAVSQQSGTKAPDTVLVDGKPYSLQQGRIFLYIFDPECMHCFRAAQQMTSYAWKDVRVVGVPTRVPQFAGQFLNDTGLKAILTSDAALLLKTFHVNTDPPYGVAIENGRQKAAFAVFEDQEPRAGLKSLGWVD